MRTLVAANWKMNKTRAEARSTAHDLAAILGGAPDNRDVVVFAPFTALEATKEGLDRAPGVFLGAQDVYPAESGAFTGEISPAMLQDAGTMSVSEISRRLGIAKPNITPLVDRLYEAGYVDRQHDENDRRVVNIVLLPAGSQKLTAIRATISRQIQTQAEDLSVSEFRELHDALESVVRILSSL